jgi:hypothetical protein
MSTALSSLQQQQQQQQRWLYYSTTNVNSPQQCRNICLRSGSVAELLRQAALLQCSAINKLECALWSHCSSVLVGHTAVVQ